MFVKINSEKGAGGFSGERVLPEPVCGFAVDMFPRVRRLNDSRGRQAATGFSAVTLKADSGSFLRARSVVP